MSLSCDVGQCMRHARKDLGLKFWVEEHGLPKKFHQGHQKRLRELAAKQDPAAIAALEEDEGDYEELDADIG